MTRRYLTDEDLDPVAQMLIPTLEAIAAKDYPTTRTRGCRQPGCDRQGYARGRCYAHDKETRQWRS